MLHSARLTNPSERRRFVWIPLPLLRGRHLSPLMTVYRRCYTYVSSSMLSAISRGCWTSWHEKLLGCYQPSERVFFCGIAPPTNCGPWWRSKASRYALMHAVGVARAVVQTGITINVPDVRQAPGFIQPLMPPLDFEHAISLLSHYAIMQGRSQGPFKS